MERSGTQEVTSSISVLQPRVASSSAAKTITQEPNIRGSGVSSSSALRDDERHQIPLDCQLEESTVGAAACVKGEDPTSSRKDTDSNTRSDPAPCSSSDFLFGSNFTGECPAKGRKDKNEEEDDHDTATEYSWEYTLESSQPDGGSLGKNPMCTVQPAPNQRNSFNRKYSGGTRALKGHSFRDSNNNRSNRYSRPKDSTHQRVLDDLTVNKLQFQKLGRLYGRDVERQSLHEIWGSVRGAWHKVHTKASSGTGEEDYGVKSSSVVAKRRLITIAGAAGTGKSALAETLCEVVGQDGGFFLMGKFPQQQKLSFQSVEPYAAFVNACNELCELVVSLATPYSELDVLSEVDGCRGDESNSSMMAEEGEVAMRRSSARKQYNFTLADFRERLEQDVGADAPILTRLAPSLLQLLKTTNGGSTVDSIGYREAHHQFKHAFRRLIRAVTSFGPIALVLDDLQWADAASMELLEAILTDRENRTLLVIGCYRDDKEYAQMPHLKALDALRADECVVVGSISIGNLTKHQVYELLLDLLSLSESETLALAECVERKTLGNVFFVIQFLTSLQDEELLAYNIGALRWTCDVPAIQASAVATENVVSLMLERMNRLPLALRQVLPIMACLGSTVNVDLFTLVSHQFAVDLDGLPTPYVSEEVGIVPNDNLPRSESFTSLECLSLCEKEGLIDLSLVSGEHSFHWVHDKIQESVFRLLSEDELACLKLKIGKKLYDELDQAKIEQHLFTVANLVTESCTDSTSSSGMVPLDVARICLRAGTKSMEASAFDQAVEYLETGIRQLPDGCWESQYSLTLELHSAAAEAAYCTGNFDSVRAHADQVLKQTNRPLLDHRRVYNVLLDSTAAGEGMALAHTMCESLLTKLRCRFPKRAVGLHVLSEIIRVKSTLKKYTASQTILQLPLLDDEEHEWLMTLLDKFTTYSYLVTPNSLPLVVFKGLHLTLSHGLSDFSPPMFAFVGLLMAAFVQDYKAGQAFANQAIDLLKLVRCSRKVESRVLFLTHAFVLHWVSPVSQSLKPLRAAYEVGMAMGDTESAGWGVYFYLEHSFRIGTSLRVLLDDCAFYAEVMREAKQRTNMLDTLCNLWQSILHLTGANKFPGSLTGDVMNQEEALGQVQDKDYQCLHAAIHRMQMYVAFVFGEHDVVYQSMRETGMDKGLYEKIFPGIFGICHLYAYNGLSMVSLYRKSKDKKYLKLAKAFAAKIKQWVGEGNPNVTHYDALLDAEMESLRGHNYVAASRYEMAVLSSGRCGFVHDCALAHERYSEHLYRLGSQHLPDAQYQMCEAVRLYEEWGAHAKVQQLQRLHEVLLGPSSEIRIELPLDF